MPKLVPKFGSPVRGGSGKSTLPKTLNLTLDGNSLTAYVGYPAMLASLINSSYTLNLRNFAVSGQTTTQMLSDVVAEVDKPLHKAASHNIVFVMEGINDLYFGATAVTAYENLRTYCLGRRAYGFKVILGTLTPRTNSGTPPSYETDRLAVNMRIRSNWLDFADAILDLGGHELIGQTGQSENTTYYPDKVHFTPAGNTIIANQLAKTINRLLP